MVVVAGLDLAEEDWEGLDRVVVVADWVVVESPEALLRNYPNTLYCIICRRIL